MKEILETTLDPEKTMTEKVQFLNEKYICHVRPTAWFSKTFTQGQVMRYTSMEKEFSALLLAVLHFREYLERVPLTHVLSDSQSVLWALNSQGENLKLTRHITKLLECNLNLILTHIEGKKNAISDFLSRISLDENSKIKK